MFTTMRIDTRKVAELDRLRAYRRLDIERESFITLADTALEEVGPPLSQSHRLRLSDRSRLLVCRLSAAAITADGQVTVDECRVCIAAEPVGCYRYDGGARHHARPEALMGR